MSEMLLGGGAKSGDFVRCSVVSEDKCGKMKITFRNWWRDVLTRYLPGAFLTAIGAS